MGGQDQNSAHISSAAANLEGSSGSTYGPMFVAPTPDELNETLTQFEVIELLGQGGMGAVYKARQPRLDRFVAIKLLPAFAGIDEHSFGERFEREARAMAKMNHPNIITVHDFGETEGGHRYIVMEYVDGYDLHHAIQSGKLTTKHAMAWIPQICSALSYAHDHDLVHRDIKPANILISKEGNVKVGDFGLAKLVGHKHETSITRTQVSMGTPDYAAPEALEEGSFVDRRADIYSMGVLFYELLTGKVPRGAWKPPSAYTDVDVRLDQIIVKAMQPDPDHRYQTVDQMTQSLDEVRKSPKMVVSRSESKPLLTGSVQVPSQKEINQLTNLREGAVSKAGKKKKRKGAHPLFVAGIAMGGTLLAVGFILIVLSNQQPAVSQPSEPPPPVIDPAPSKEEPVVVVDSPPAKTPNPRDFGPKPGKAPIRPVKRPDFPVEMPKPKDGWVDLMDRLEMGRNAMRENWTLHEDGVLEMKGEPNKGEYPHIPFFIPIKGSYEVEFEISRTASQRPIGILLPVAPQAVLLVLDAASKTDRQTCTGLSSIDGLAATHPRNPTRKRLELENDRIYRLQIQVINEGRETGIFAALDSNQIVRWEGERDQLALPEEANSAKIRRALAVMSQAPMTLSHARLRALEQGTALAGKPRTNPDTPTPQMATGEVAEKLASIQKTIDERIAVEAEAPFEELVANKLHKDYGAALHRLIESAERSGDLLNKASAQRELDRITNMRPIEPDDPPEMPQAVKDARSRYRIEIGKLESQRDLLVLPILRDQLAQIEELQVGFADVGNTDAAKQVDVAVRGLRERITTIEGSIQPQPEAPEEASPPSLPTPTSSPDSSVLLERRPFPPERPTAKGSVISWGKNGDIPKTGIGDIPAGLATTAVAIAGSPEFVVALKSNGKLEAWWDLEDSKLELEEIPDQLDDLSRVVDVSVSQNQRIFHLAALSEDGKVNVLSEGWSDMTDTYHNQAAEIQGAVELSTTIYNGFAILNDGTIGAWGYSTQNASPQLPDQVAKFAEGPSIQAAIREDSSVIAFGPALSSFPPNLTQARDIAFGTQPILGGLCQLPNGQIVTFGSFTRWQNEMTELASSHSIEKIVAGFEAFAVRTSDGEWHFFGQNIDPDYNAEQARDCSDLVIGRGFVIGLRPL